MGMLCPGWYHRFSCSRMMPAYNMHHPSLKHFNLCMLHAGQFSAVRRNESHNTLNVVFLVAGWCQHTTCIIPPLSISALCMLYAGQCSVRDPSICLWKEEKQPCYFAIVKGKYKAQQQSKDSQKGDKIERNNKKTAYKITSANCFPELGLRPGGGRMWSINPQNAASDRGGGVVRQGRSYDKGGYRQFYTIL